MLRLSGFPGGCGLAEVAQGLALAGFFPERHVFAPAHQALPSARQRLAERFPAAPQLET